MGNEEDWKKLYQWKEQKEEEQRADLERRKHPTRGMKQQEKEEKSDNLSLLAKGIHFMKELGEVLLTYKDEVRLSIIVVGICMAMVLWNIAVVPKPERAVEKKYEKDFFCVSEQEIAPKTKLYTYAAKNYPDLYFHVKLEQGSLTEDVKASALKYFYERLEHPLKEKFMVEMKEENGMLVQYRLCYIFHGIDEVEEAVDAVYEMREILKEEVGETDQIYTRSDSYLFLTLFYDPNLNLEQSKEEGKRQYVSMWQERMNKKKKTGENITEEEKDEGITAEILEKYCRQDLAIYIDGKSIMKKTAEGLVPVKAHYAKGQYEYQIEQEILEKIPGVTILENEDVYLCVFQYKGAEYTSNDVRYEEDITNIFDVTFAYDYANAKVNIRTKSIK